MNISGCTYCWIKFLISFIYFGLYLIDWAIWKLSVLHDVTNCPISKIDALDLIKKLIVNKIWYTNNSNHHQYDDYDKNTVQTKPWIIDIVRILNIFRKFFNELCEKIIVFLNWRVYSRLCIIYQNFLSSFRIIFLTGNCVLEIANIFIRVWVNWDPWMRIIAIYFIAIFYLFLFLKAKNYKKDRTHVHFGDLKL